MVSSTSTLAGAMQSPHIGLKRRTAASKVFTRSSSPNPPLSACLALKPLSMLSSVPFGWTERLI
jgi:hypothetical protein